MKEKEHRSTYIEIKELIWSAAAHSIAVIRTEPLTCRTVVNMGLECVVAGVEMLKIHGVTKAATLGFVELLFDHPGEIEEVRKGGKNEHVLRAAMRIINGEIVRHGPLGPEVEGASHGKLHDVAVEQEPLRINRESDQRFN